MAWAIRFDIATSCQVVPSGLVNPRIQVLNINYRSFKSTLANVYLPPDGDATIIALIWDALGAVIDVSQELVVVGDLNGVEDPRMDRETLARSLSAGERAIRDRRIDWDLTDVYRERYPDI
jgi:hypothetical protein